MLIAAAMSLRCSVRRWFCSEWIHARSVSCGVAGERKVNLRQSGFQRRGRGTTKRQKNKEKKKKQNEGGEDHLEDEEFAGFGEEAGRL